MSAVTILNKINNEIKELTQNPNNLIDYSRFHKDNKKHISLATPLIRKLSAKKFQKVKHFTKNKFLNFVKTCLNINIILIEILHLTGLFALGNNTQKKILQCLRNGHTSSTFS